MLIGINDIHTRRTIWNRKLNLRLFFISRAKCYYWKYDINNDSKNIIKIWVNKNLTILINYNFFID